jgi:SAM-dependent methyltransferase
MPLTLAIPLGTLALIITLFVAGIASLISMQIARKSAAPFFPTPASAIREALREVGLKPGEVFYDLGAGNGKALLIAEREFGAHAVGYEISIAFYLIAKINLWAHRSYAKILFKSFWDADLRDADVLFIFLAERTMQKMQNKLKTGLKPGARLIVFAFPLPDHTPTKIITVHGPWKMFVYKS